MSIFSKIRPFSKSHRPAIAVQQTRDAVRTVKVWVGGDKVFRLTQDPNALERDGGYEFTLHWTSGTETDSKGFDSEADADLYAWHLATPLPETSDYADEPPVLSLSTEHDPVEKAWWSRQTGGGVVEGQPDPNDLIYSTEAADDWLDDLTVDQMQALSDDFGGGFIGGFESW